MNVVPALKQVLPRALWPYLGVVRRSVRSLSLRTERQKRKLLSDPSLNSHDRQLLSRVSSRIYYNDGMYHGNGVHYFKVGLSAIRCIDEAINHAGISDVRTILDFPCGGGRVLRFLVQHFPQAEITACELQPGVVKFCQRTFGAQPAISSLNLDEVRFAVQFDLIWCGSLVTHLNQRGILSLLRLCQRHLRPGGLAVLTTHGDFVAQRLPAREFDYGLAAEDVDNLPELYIRNGFAFADYPGETDYGVSLTSPYWVRSRISEMGDLKEVYFKARAWDDHQDIFGFVKGMTSLTGGL